MEFRQFQYVLKVAQIGNITKAAEELYMTQSALSHCIANLEKEEGIKIFDRTTNPMTLTYAGERYVNALRKIMTVNDQLQVELKDIDHHIKGRLTIGIPPARAVEMLPRFLPEFVREFPGVSIQTVEHNSRQLQDDVRRGRADFAILPMLDGLGTFQCVELYKEELYLVTQAGALPKSASYEDAKGDLVVDVSALKGQKFILMKSGHGARAALNVLLDCNGVKPDIFMETTNNGTALSLASAGLGIAVVPRMNLDSQIAPHPIDLYRLSESGLHWTIAAIFNAGEPEKYLAARCVELIREAYNQQ